MTERDLSTLLKSAAENPPTSLDTDQLLGTVRDRRFRRWHRAVGAALVAAVVGIGVTYVVQPWDDPSTNASSGGAAAQPSTTTDAADACPPVIKDPNVQVDYVDLVILSGLQYVNVDDTVSDVRLGSPVDTVGCSVAEITENMRWHVGSMPWPDRTATYLTRGAELYAIVGVDPGCKVAARVDGRTVVYTALDPAAQTATPAC